MKSPWKLVLLATTVLGIAPSMFSQAKNIYITQNGSPSGNCTTNVQSLLWFNNGANWGNGPSQIGPGTTVLVCGTFTLAAGGTGFQFQGSGSNNSPITFQFDNGATIQAPYFSGTDEGGSGSLDSGGGVDINGYNYITVDGQSTGVIQATANGSNLANQRAGVGVYAYGDHILIENLTIQGIYVNGSSEPTGWTNGQYSADILVDYGSTNIEICNNTLSDGRSGIAARLSGGGGSSMNGPNGCTNAQANSGWNIHGNSLNNHGWHIVSGGAATINVYNNSVGPGWWVYPDCGAPAYSCNYHTDGIFFNGSGVTTAYVYNNYVYGTNKGYETGDVYCSIDFGSDVSGTQCNVFNNILVGVVGSGTGAIGSGGAVEIADQGYNGTQYIYNNVLQGGSYSIWCCYTNGISSPQTRVTSQNNILIGQSQSIVPLGGWTIVNQSPCSYTTENYDLIYNERNGGGEGCNSVTYNFSSWQGIGQNKSGVYANPNLNSDYSPASGSPAIGLGTNLTGLGNNALDVSAPMGFGAGGSCGAGCQSRPGSGAGSWDSGAYEASATAPAPPTNVVATVN